MHLVLGLLFIAIGVKKLQHGLLQGSAPVEQKSLAITASLLKTVWVIRFRSKYPIKYRIFNSLIALDKTAMDAGCTGFVYVHGWTVVGQYICTGRTVVGQCRSYCRGAVQRSIQLIYLG